MKSIRILALAFITIAQFSYCSEKNTNTDPAVTTDDSKPVDTTTAINNSTPTNPTNANKSIPAKSNEWSTTTKIAAGLAGTAVLAGAVHVYDPNAFTYLAEQTNDLINWISGETSQAEQQKLAEQLKRAEEKAELARLELERLAAEQKLAEEQRLAEIARLKKEKSDADWNANLAIGAGSAAIGIGIGNQIGKYFWNNEKDKTEHLEHQLKNVRARKRLAKDDLKNLPETNHQQFTAKQPASVDTTEKRIPQIDTLPTNNTQPQNTELTVEERNSILNNIVSKKIETYTKYSTPAIGKIETVTEYLNERKNKNPLAAKNLEPYSDVINVNGDGNCAYRAFILSACINNHDHAQAYFQNLIDNHFQELFMDYDTIFNKFSPADRNLIEQAIQSMLLRTLKNIGVAKNNQEIIDIFNESIIFDYYMIMFCRYMLADYILTNEAVTHEDKALITIAVNTKREEFKQPPISNLTDIIEYECKKILTWKEWIDQLEITYLSRAMNINIHSVQLDTNFNADLILLNPLADSYILFIDNNHYQTLVKKQVA